MRQSLIALILMSAFSMVAQDREMYIDRFKDIAIVEMHRTGIPASIKLAQGILESNAGASMLAERANNHFGIKCGGEWRGKTMMRKDDDRNAQGKLIKSCFRVFESAEQSYVAHSEFLSDPNKVHRYGPLFALASDDYRSWAHGLKKAGYATNPKYPQLLIKIIETYQLDQIDREALAMVAQSSVDKPAKLSRKERRKQSLPSVRSYPVTYKNKIMTVTAFGGDSPVTLSEDLGIPARKIVKYNESIGSEFETFEAGQTVFLQPKRNKYKGDQEFHIVKQGETMLEISDLYGIKVESLYKRNQIIAGLQPAPGQRLTLRKKNKNKVKVISRAHPEEVDPEVYEEEGFLETLEPTRSAPKQEGEVPAVVIRNEMPKDTTIVIEPAFYVVQPKDTLYGIARRHGITVDTLKKLNNLADSTIHPGQKLILDK